ncbi:hypothetical protein niasHT_019639 [Heterodera trifolii]|uniref:Uncharacterized protein n=1 Tax=Heterodera trifolii TaxID=157864 RepID=A0ABD2L785_9BILA
MENFGRGLLQALPRVTLMRLHPLQMLFLLPFVSFVCFSHFAFGGKSLRGKVYARMELCQSPQVTVRRMGDKGDSNRQTVKCTSSNATTTFSVPPMLPTKTSKDNPFFHIDLSDFSATTIQIEAVKKSFKISMPYNKFALRATYALDTATIDWKGAHELLLFNDVSVLAFGYKTEQ